MKLNLFESKKVNKIEYLSAKQIKELFPITDFPSVTAVLKDPKKDAWLRSQLKDKNSVVSKAVDAGNKAHRALETGEVNDPLTEAVLLKFEEEIGCDIDEVWGQEQWLAHPSGYKGKFDGIGIYKGELTLFDYKKTNRRKTQSGLDSYFSQLMAYKQAHEYLYKTPITRVAIFNIFGKKPEDIGTKVSILSVEGMKQYLSIFMNKLQAYGSTN